MWAARYFPVRFWATRYWSKVGDTPAPLTGLMLRTQVFTQP
jgi:hypothetical protein